MLTEQSLKKKMNGFSVYYSQWWLLLVNSF